MIHSRESDKQVNNAGKMTPKLCRGCQRTMDRKGEKGEPDSYALEGKDQ